MSDSRSGSREIHDDSEYLVLPERRLTQKNYGDILKGQGNET